MSSASIFFNDWQRVRLIEQEQRARSYAAFQRTFLKLARFLLHLVVGLGVLATGLITKASILYILNKQGEGSRVRKGSGEERTEEEAVQLAGWTWTLVLTILAHYFVEFCVCLTGVVFRQQRTPSLGQLSVVSNQS